MAKATTSTAGTAGSILLEPKSVAAFHAEVVETLARPGIQAPIRAVPNEVEPAIPFAEDHQRAPYDPGAIRTFWQQLIQADRVLKVFSWDRAALETNPDRLRHPPRP